MEVCFFFKLNPKPWERHSSSSLDCQFLREIFFYSPLFPLAAQLQLELLLFLSTSPKPRLGQKVHDMAEAISSILPELFQQPFFAFARSFPAPSKLHISLSSCLNTSANPNPSLGYEPGTIEKHSILQKETLLAALCLLWEPLSSPTLAAALWFLSPLTLHMDMVLHSQIKQIVRALSRLKGKYNNNEKVLNIELGTEIECELRIHF